MKDKKPLKLAQTNITDQEKSDLTTSEQKEQSTNKSKSLSPLPTGMNGKDAKPMAVEVKDEFGQRMVILCDGLTVHKRTNETVELIFKRNRHVIAQFQNHSWYIIQHMPD